MKKTHILTLLIMLTVSVAFGQTPYKLNYPDITIGNSPTGKIVLNGSNLRLPRIATSSAPDSLLALVDGKVVKVATSEIASNLTFSNGLTKTGNNVSLGGNAFWNYPNYVIVQPNDNSKGGLLQLKPNGTFIGIQNEDGSSFSGLSILPNDQSYYRDDIQNTGLKYFANYSANFTARSLVDKEYVDSKTPDLSGYAKLNENNVFTGYFQTIQGSGDDFPALNIKDDFRGATLSPTSLTFSTNGVGSVLLRGTNVTGAREIGLPDKSGTIALLSDISGAGGSYELLANKSTTLTSPNNTTYPTTLAVSDRLATGQNIGANTTGNAATSSNTMRINGFDLEFATAATNPDGFVTYNDSGVTIRRSTFPDIKSKLGVATQARYTASGNGSSTAIVIPHGLTGITSTSSVIAFANSSAATGITFATIDATNVTVNYTVAPASGTNNLIYTISIK